MRRLVQALEPLWWALFVSGTFVSALLLPGILLVVGIAVPAGLASPELLAFERVHGLAAALPGRLLLAALVICCLWNGAHHLRHFHIDLGGLRRDVPAALLLYAIAGVGSLLAVLAVIRL